MQKISLLTVNPTIVDMDGESSPSIEIYLDSDGEMRSEVVGRVDKAVRWLVAKLVEDLREKLIVDRDIANRISEAKK